MTLFTTRAGSSGTDPFISIFRRCNLTPLGPDCAASSEVNLQYYLPYRLTLNQRHRVENENENENETRVLLVADEHCLRQPTREASRLRQPLHEDLKRIIIIHHHHPSSFNHGPSPTIHYTTHLRQSTAPCGTGLTGGGTRNQSLDDRV